MVNSYLEAFQFVRKYSRYNKKYQVETDADQTVIPPISEDIFKNPVRKLKYHLLRADLASFENKYIEAKNELEEAENTLNSLSAVKKFWFFYLKLTEGIFYKRVRDYNLAIYYFNELEYRVQHEKELRKLKYFVYANLLQINDNLGQAKLTLEYIDKLQPYLSQKPHPFFYLDYIRIGEVYSSLGQFDKALSYFQKAENVFIQYDIKDEKLLYLRMAEDIGNHYYNPYIESSIVKEVGKYYYDKQEYDLAIINFNLVLDDVERLVNDEEYFKSKYLYLSRSNYLNNLDYCAASFYYLSEQKGFDMIALKHSYKNYKYLVLLREKMLSNQGFEKSRIYSLKRLRKAFENLFEVGYTLYKQTNDNTYLFELFSYSEKSKAYMLKNYVSDELAKSIGGIPENLIEEARIIKKEIDSMQYSFSQVGSQAYGSWDGLLVNRILDKQKQYDEFIKSLEKKYPSYSRIKRQQNIISINQIQSMLSSDQALLEYFFIFNSFYAFYIDKDTVSISCAPIDREFPQELKAYRSLFDRVSFNEFNSEKITSFIRQSYSIYSLAIKPFEQLISDKRLIIVPDEELNLIPFETLITKPPDSLMKTSYRDLPYLINRNAISYIYSASQLSAKGGFDLQGIDYAGFAPDYSNIELYLEDSTSMKLQPLPGAKDEIQSAKKYFRGRVYMNSDVNKAKYFKECQRRKIIHLAMHAVLDSIEPMNSWFLISPFNISSNERKLHAYEIYSRKISSSLVLLSACNTGMGKVNRGEGIFSIARAFLLAGVKDVIYTQWSIADRSSAELMDRFYYYLSQGMPTDVALQKAKVDFILKGDPVKAFPFYWAAYVLEGTPIELHSHKKIFVGLSLSIVVILIAFLVWRNRRKS